VHPRPRARGGHRAALAAVLTRCASFDRRPADAGAPNGCHSSILVSRGRPRVRAITGPRPLERSAPDTAYRTRRQCDEQVSRQRPDLVEYQRFDSRVIACESDPAERGRDAVELVVLQRASGAACLPRLAPRGHALRARKIGARVHSDDTKRPAVAAIAGQTRQTDAGHVPPRELHARPHGSQIRARQTTQQSPPR
jgi:hypothetical protein